MKDKITYDIDFLLDAIKTAKGLGWSKVELRLMDNKSLIYLSKAKVNKSSPVLVITNGIETHGIFVCPRVEQ